MPAKKIIDDDEVVVKKTSKKVVADDDEVIVKKTKKVVADDDEDVPTKKTSKKAAVSDEAASASASTSAAPTRRAAAAGGFKLSTGTSSESNQWVAPDYDDMSFEQFKRLLDTTSMAEAMAQKSAYDNQLIAKEIDAAKNQVEAFMDGAEGGYQYNDMLSRATVLMRERGIGDSNTRSVEIPPPQMEKIGTKRIVIGNFAAICDAIHRNTAEVKEYFDRQTNASTSLDASQALILKMKLDGKGVERIFDKYMKEWVTCDVCKSIDTITEKQKNMNRLYCIRCNKCKASRYVEMGEAAYAANTTKRSKLRTAAAML